MNPSTIFAVLRIRQVAQRIGLSPSHIYAMLDAASSSYDPCFPHQIRLGPSAVGWLEHEIQDWIMSRSRVSRNKVEQVPSAR